MNGLTELACALTRRWVQFYTKGMPPELGECRRAEVAADLWQHQQEGRASGRRSAAIALEILVRALLGAPDDLGWRRETVKAWRASTLETRRTMTISMGRLRGMGLAAVLGGVVWTGGSLIPDAGRAFEVVYVIGSMLLCVVGVFGFYVQQRPRAGRLGSIGLMMLLGGFTFSLIAVTVAELVRENHPVAGVFGILSWPTLIPLGFLFVGLGISIRYRSVLLGVAVFQILGLLRPVGSALKKVFPPAEVLFSNVGTGVLWAIGLAVIGYAVVSGTRVHPTMKAAA